jgi:membrane dipeptidase
MQIGFRERGRLIIVPRVVVAAILAAAVGAASACAQGVAAPDTAKRAEAGRLAQELLIVDTHIDLPSRLLEENPDVSVRTKGGDFDYVRARTGGLDVGFMSIYVPSEFEGTSKATERAETEIDAVLGLARGWPGKFAVVSSTDDVERKAGKGKILLAMGMENGAPILGDISRVAYYRSRGISYITLAHAKNNHICDASYDHTRKWNGLSPFGRTLVAEMNRVGIMIDVSHLSDSAFYQVVRLTKAPVIASHSSCRSFTPGFERNMNDAMIRRLAENGGVVQINFGSSFINNEFRRAEEQREKAIDRHLKEAHLNAESKQGEAYAHQYRRDHPVRRPTVRDVAAHVDHVVKLVGVDHVGFGSDFEGVGDSLPEGLKDVGDYPNLLAELLALGYTRDDLRKICGGNLLRVWRDVERVARESGGKR